MPSQRPAPCTLFTPRLIGPGLRLEPFRPAARGTLTRRHRTGQASSLAGAREQPQQQQQQQQQRSIVLVFERTRRRRRSDKRPRHHSPIPAHPQRHQSLHVCPPTRLERIIRIISTSCAMPEGSANNVTWSCHYLGPFKAQRQTVE